MAKNSHKLRNEGHFKSNSDPSTCGKESRPSQATNQPTPPLHLAMPPYLMNLTTSMAALTPMRWPSRLGSRKVTNPSQSLPPTCMWNWAGRLLVLMVSPGASSGPVLCCAVQLTEVWTDIFNLSLAQAAFPTCFKTTSIVLVQNTTLQQALMTSVQLHSSPSSQVLWEAGPQNQLMTHIGPLPVCLPAEQQYITCHLYRASHHPLPSRQQ